MWCLRLVGVSTFNCLGSHLVKDCTQRCDCRRCQGSDICKHFFMLHEYFAPTVPKSFGNNERVNREENDDRNPSVAQCPSFPGSECENWFN